MAAALAPPPPRSIPTSFPASFRAWWAAGDTQAAISEQRLIRRIVVPAKLVLTSFRVPLSNPKHFINTISFKNGTGTSSSTPPAVLLHGYGAGLAFFFHNLSALTSWADRTGSSLYALDWLGMGRSSRVPFTITAPRTNIPARVAQAEAFFIDSLEDWRSRMGIERMALVGHSLGAYFSVAYALKYPDRVSRLVLLSPAGVPQGPTTEDPSRELTDDSSVLNDEKFAKTQRELSSVERAARLNFTRVREGQIRQQNKESRARKLLTYLWEEGWSPFQIVRSTLFWSPMLIGKYSSRRFPGLSKEETCEMHDYILNITLAKGSGEYCISHILAPGAYARMPLVDRVDALKIPVTFVYGEHDWMDSKGGADSVERMKKAGNDQGKMYIVKNAGHHLYLDNPKIVNELLVRELSPNGQQSQTGAQE